ncbi:putative DNA topoisomerase 2 [Cryptosporidium felis]|nr:putative DNA topoisomerase 2 [Cryptosporidium felis]
MIDSSQGENDELLSNSKLASKSRVMVRKTKKTVEERYQKKTQIEHILLRPDTYIGSTEFHEQTLWVWDNINKRMVYKQINYVPGLYKIFDEILVNAADVKAREISNRNSTYLEKCTCIKVEISRERNEITVYNDGEGIPIEIHREHQIYVPELIFGHLLTSDNYDDNEDRVTGGRNGFGAKLTNIFSKEFKVECGDNNTGRIFKLSWFNNMSSKSEETVKESYSGKSYVKITFKPDLKRFGNMSEFDDDITSLLYKRVYDISGTTGVKVYLNGDLIPIKDFKSYALLYLKPKIPGESGTSNDSSIGGTTNIAILNERGEKRSSRFAGNSRKGRIGPQNLGGDVEENDENDSGMDDYQLDADGCLEYDGEDDEWDDENTSSKAANSRKKKSNPKKKKIPTSASGVGGGGSSSIIISGGGGAGGSGSPLIIYENVPNWEVVISESDSGQFQHVSFVNSICTIKGGTHVSYVLDPLINAILKKVQTKNKGGMDIKGHHVKNHIWIFIKCLIVNPSFDSQTKETLTTKTSKFGSVCTLSEKTINAVIKSSIVENVLMWAQLKQSMELKKKMKSSQKNTVTSRILGIPKLEDANEAGGPHSSKCTLILTEGDSAKTSCLAGLSIVGRDYYGVFPLRGKLLNVREASFKQQIGNLEIQNILKILGLGIGQKYENGPVNLRYGSLMLMTDQDHDGSHIKGLIINLIHYYWPNLIQFSGFLKQFVTPIVKAKKGASEIPFFTLVEYEQWRKNNSSKLAGWRFKYYKGLGTSTDLEFKEYFTNIENHSIEFDWKDEQDDEAIDMAFSKKRTEDRKIWIESYKDGTYVDYSINNQYRNLRYFDFIHKELVLFSRYDTTRSIPNLMDGLKPGQRKVLFAAFKKKLNTELKVAQLAGYVAEHSAYHHGESSLQSTIVNMAQNFVGSNNLNLLQPCGQFGSRKEGGKDASAARYIFTKLSAWTRYIFPEADDPLLTYLYDDGQQIEPLYYVPIIPMILVNGTDGIGTGWSSSVPNYNPKDIIANLKRVLRGEIMQPMTPWYKSFKGSIVPIRQRSKKSGTVGKRKANNSTGISGNSGANNNGSSFSSLIAGSQGEPEEEEETLELGANYETFGSWQKRNEETLVITELPVRRWTQDYKEWLESALLPAPNADSENIESSWIIDYRDNSSHENVHITVRMRPEKLQQAEQEGVEKIFRLKSTLSTSNMTLFDHNSRIVRYETELDILKEFIPIRLEMYEKRKRFLLSKLSHERLLLEQKILFLRLVIQGTIQLSNKSKESLVSELKRNKIKSIRELHGITRWNAGDSDFGLDKDYAEVERSGYEDSFQNEEAVLEDGAYHHQGQEPEHGNELRLFDYLLSMPLWSLTKEKMELLESELLKKTQDYDKLLKTTVEEMWNAELDELLEVIQKEETQEEATIAEHQSLVQKRRLSVDWSETKKGRAGSRKRKNDSSKKQAAAPVPTKSQKSGRKDSRSSKRGKFDDSSSDAAQGDDLFHGSRSSDEGDFLEEDESYSEEDLCPGKGARATKKSQEKSRGGTGIGGRASRTGDAPKGGRKAASGAAGAGEKGPVLVKSSQREDPAAPAAGASAPPRPLESVSLLQRLQQRTNLVNGVGSREGAGGRTFGSSFLDSKDARQTKITEIFQARRDQGAAKRESEKSQADSSPAPAGRRSRRKVVLESEEEKEEEDFEQQEEEEAEEVEEPEADLAESSSSDSIAESDFSEYSD